MMDAYEEFKALMHNWVRIVGACLGYDIQPDHIGVNALIVVSLFCSVTIPCLYFSAYLTLDGDIAMAGAGLTGTALKIAVKSVFIFLARHRIIESFKYFIKIYQQNRGTAENEDILRRFVRHLRTAVRIMICNYLGIMMVCTFGPIAAVLLSDDQRPFSLPFVLPGTSLEPVGEYILNLTAQIVYEKFITLAYALFESLIVIQVMHVILMTKILRRKIHAVSAMTDGGDFLQRPRDVVVNLRNLINLHNEMNRYCENLQDLYYYPIACVVFLAAASVSLKIFFVLTVESVAVAILYIGVAEVFEMAYYCGMGTVIDVSYDNLYEELTQIEWYQLSMVEQKAFGLLLHCAKNPKSLSVADVLPLNANTFLVVMQRIYSFTMLLKNSL